MCFGGLVEPTILMSIAPEKATAMRGFIRSMLQAIRRFWMAASGRKGAQPEVASREAVVHDPAAQRPHDLDDPYFDPKVQRRFADVIAKAMHDKRWKNS